MHRGSLIVAVLSLLGGVVSLVIAAVLRDPQSLYLVLAAVLLANALVRYRIARRVPQAHSHPDHGYMATDTALPATLPAAPPVTPRGTD